MDWQPMETAPRDGTAFQARVPGHGSDYVISWFNGLIGDDGEDCGSWAVMSEQEPPDDWCDGICWATNSYGVPSTLPDGWKQLAHTDTGEG